MVLEQSRLVGTCGRIIGHVFLDPPLSLDRHVVCSIKGVPEHIFMHKTRDLVPTRAVQPFLLSVSPLHPMSICSRFTGWITPILRRVLPINRRKEHSECTSSPSRYHSPIDAGMAGMRHRERFSASGDKDLSGFCAMTLSDRFDLYSDENDLDEAILRFQTAVQFPLDNTSSSILFNCLRILVRLLFQRYERKNEEKDFDDMVSYGHQAAKLSPDGRSPHLPFLAKAGLILFHRFLQNGDTSALTNAIHRFEEALKFPPADRQEHTVYLLSLAWSLLERLDRREDNQDLDDALVHLRQAITLDPSSDVDKGQHQLLYRAALKLKQRSSKNRDMKDLDDAIRIYQEALDFPADPLLHSLSLFHQAAALISRFNHQHNQQDLKVAAQRFLEGLELTSVRNGGLQVEEAEIKPFFVFLIAFWPDQSHEYHESNIVKGVVQLLQIGGALDDPILLLRYGAKTLLPSHPQRSQLLLYLGKALAHRYKTNGEEKDKNDAIRSLEEALALRPDGASSRAEVLYELAEILSNGKEQGDMDKHFRYCQEALALLPADHEYCPKIMISLAGTYDRIYLQTREKWAIDESISLHTKSQLHPKFDRSYSSFGNSLIAHLKESRDNPKLPHEDMALDELLLQLQNMGLSSSVNSAALGQLANILCVRFETCLSHDPHVKDDHLQSAMRLFNDAAHGQLSSPFECLQASIKWAYYADKYEHNSDLEAYARCMYLIDIHLSTGTSLPSRHQMRVNFPPYLAGNAASCALRRGNLAKALELLEQGRTLIWTQLSRYNTPVQTLMQGDEIAKKLGHRFRDLGDLLNNTPITNAENVDNLEVASRSFRIVVEDWNRIVAEIRQIDGYSRFLLPPQISDLQEAAVDGPVVVLVASVKSCDAIIVSSKGSPLHLRLKLTINELTPLANRLRTVVRRTQNDSEQDQQLRGLLQQCWDSVVEPVVAVLEQVRVAEKKSRIWWCPTSLFAYLPLHAAGDYSRPNGRHLSQLYIPSYTPSLSALIRSRREYRTMEKCNKFAVIGQAQPAGDYPPLESVETEIDFVESIVRERVPAAEVTKVPSSISTKAVALDALRENGWLHCSCHGVQEFEKPYDSCLRMRDGPLSLQDIAQADLRSHEFVFLSACETAVGELRTPDEVIHLAAGLQFSGVKSVVGTMWEVEDATVQYLVKAFYKNMFVDGRMDGTKAAWALHKALRSPEVKNMSLVQRVVFIHIGI